MTPLFEIRIRRDAHTITPVTVPEYEVPVLQELFGVENVQNAEGKRADENGIGSPVASFKASDDEYERFCVKYGVELVELVYGKKGSKALEKAMADTKAKPTAKGKQAAV